MKKGVLILILALASTGCLARKVITVPAKTAIKATGKIAGGTVKAAIPDESKKQ